MLSFKKIPARARIGATVGATLLAMLFAVLFTLPASAATTGTGASVTQSSSSPIPRTHNCNPDLLVTVIQCTTVNNHRLRVKSIIGYGYNDTPGPLNDLHVQIYYAGKNGKKSVTIKNCHTFNLGPFPDRSPECTWDNPHPDKNVKAGLYCSRTWQNNGHGNFSVLGSECEKVER
jgi:hypothetical protein